MLLLLQHLSNLTVNSWLLKEQWILQFDEEKDTVDITTFDERNGTVDITFDERKDTLDIAFDERDTGYYICFGF